MSEELSVESRISPPALSCPKCNELLPYELGEVQCTMCSAKVKVEHEGTRKKWADEKVSCLKQYTDFFELGGQGQR